MATLTGQRRVTLLSKAAEQDVSITGSNTTMADPTLAVAKIGALTTRTDDNTGTLTMNASHGIETGNRLDVYWAGGSRLGMTVGTVSVNSVPIDGGAGDVLPADESPITAMVPTLYDFDVDTADLLALMVACASPAGAVFRTSVPAEILVVQVDESADYLWTSDTGEANPLSGNVVDVFLSHGSSSAARQVNAVALTD